MVTADSNNITADSEKFLADGLSLFLYADFGEFGEFEDRLHADVFTLPNLKIFWNEYLSLESFANFFDKYKILKEFTHKYYIITGKDYKVGDLEST